MSQTGRNHRAGASVEVRMRLNLMLIMVIVMLAAGCTPAPDQPDPERSVDLGQGAEADPTSGLSAEDVLAEDVLAEVVSAEDLAAGEWAPLPAAPIAPRTDAVSVWTGNRMLLWGGFADPPNDLSQGGGDNRLYDGASLDPLTGEWQPIAAAPISPDFSQTAVWTGAEMIVYGWQGSGSSGFSATPSQQAAYDPARDTWRLVSPDPLGIIDPILVTWTGDAMLVLGVPPVSLDRAGTLIGAQYDPSSDAWTEIAPSPLSGALYGANAVWTDAGAVVWGGTETYGVACALECPEPVPANAAAASYDPGSGDWTALPDAPTEVRERGSVNDAEGRLVVAYAEQVFSYQAQGGTAIALADRAVDRQSSPRIRDLWTGSALLTLTGVDQRYQEEFLGGPTPTNPPLLGGSLSTLDGETLDLPPVDMGTASGQSVVWTGRSLVVVGGRDQAGASRDTVAARNRGAILLPRGGPPAPFVDEPADFTLNGSTTTAPGPDGPLTLRMQPDDPGTLALGQSLDIELRLTSSRPVEVEVTSIRSNLRADRATGLLALVPAGCDPIVKFPGRGIQADCPTPLADAAVVVPGEVLTVQAVVQPQDEPFAPTAGVYPVTVELLVDGEASVVTVPLTLDAVSELGERTLPAQRETRALLEDQSPCAHHDKLLRNAVLADGRPDGGTFQIGVDATGWWGRLAYGARSATVTLPDGTTVGDIGEEAFLMVDGVPLRECANTPTNVALTDESGSSLGGTLTLDGLQIDIAQEVLPMKPEGTVDLVQTYTISTTDAGSRPLLLTHVTDVSTVSSGGTVSSDGRGGSVALPEAPTASQDGAVLTEQATSGPVTVAISGALDGRATPDRWTIQSNDYLANVVSTGGVPDSVDGLAQPFEGNPSYDPFSRAALVQEWQAVVGPDQPVSLRLVTTFGPS